MSKCWFRHKWKIEASTPQESHMEQLMRLHWHPQQITSDLTRRSFLVEYRCATCGTERMELLRDR